MLWKVALQGRRGQQQVAKAGCWLVNNETRRFDAKFRSHCLRLQHLLFFIWRLATAWHMISHAHNVRSFCSDDFVHRSRE
jgi:hypothetical protein